MPDEWIIMNRESGKFKCNVKRSTEQVYTIPQFSSPHPLNSHHV